MKTHKLIKITGIFVMILSLGIPLNAQAESVSSRDVSADSILLGDGNMGALPPTGGQAIAAGGVLPISGPGSNAAITVPDVRLEGIRGTGLKDSKANIYEFAGSVKKRKKGGDWEPAHAGMLVKEGDEILTGADSMVSITFDTNYANVTHFKENTKAEFRSIEPTDIYVMDGKIFNILDGLPKGAKWQVSTPVAVSTVRGTWYVVQFQLASGEFITATFNVPDDGTDSTVDIGQVKDGKYQATSATVRENQQIVLQQGQTPSQDLVTKIDPKWLQQIIDFLTRLGEYRAKNGQLPPTGSDFFNIGDPGDGGGPLDPQQDTGATLGNPIDSPPSDPEPEIERDCDGEGCDRLETDLF